MRVPPSAFSALFVCLLSIGICHATPSAITIANDLPYKAATLTAYEKQRCKLDLYLPTDRTGFPTLVWLHGGGMTSGDKSNPTTVNIARTFASAGIAVAVAEYQLNPNVRFPAYVEDAAAAFAWVHAHIADYGGNPDYVFLGGHSAGAYLTSLVGMDVRYLQKFGLGPDAIAGLIPMSGQMMTHFTVRKERGIGENTIIADEAAPIYYTRKDTPPFLIIFGNHDWPARLEENQYFVAAQKAVGNTQLKLRVIKDRDHGSIAGRISEPGDPAAKAIIAFIERISKMPNRNPVISP